MRVYTEEGFSTSVEVTDSKGQGKVNLAERGQTVC